jgi:hypothetical protein
MVMHGSDSGFLSLAVNGAKINRIRLAPTAVNPG